jgi:hypothetical protein
MVMRHEPGVPVLTEIEANAVEFATPVTDDSGEGLVDTDGDLVNFASRSAMPLHGTPVQQPVSAAGEMNGSIGRPSSAATPSQPPVRPEPIGDGGGARVVPVVARRPIPAPLQGAATPPAREAPGGGNLALYLGAGIVAGTAMAGTAYLFWRRHEHRPMLRPLSLTPVRTRLADLRATSASMRRALVARTSDRVRVAVPSAATTTQEVAPRAGTLANRPRQWLMAVGSFGVVARRRVEAAFRSLPSAKDIRLQMPFMRPRAQPSVMRAPARARVMTAFATRQRMARRRARRIARRFRWFRGGLVAGFVLGILYAPVPGRQARAQAAQVLLRVPYVREWIGEAGASPRGVGATGPHPQRGVDEMHTPLMGPTSEEPILGAPELADSSQAYPMA